MDLKNVTVSVENWHIGEVKEKRTILGSYKIKVGGFTFATEHFNGEYSSVKLPFSPELMEEVSKVSEKIVSEIINFFVKGA